jgi:hypothetical protein
MKVRREPADTPLHLAVSPFRRSTYYREYVSLLHGSERPVRGRLRGLATNLHEYYELEVPPALQRLD